MQLEAGKKYTDRRGRVYGPLVKDGAFYAEQVNCPLWSSNGQIDHDSLDMDLIAEYVESVQPESADNRTAPGEGYRLLEVGEIEKEGDEFYDANKKRWVPTGLVRSKCNENDRLNGYSIRRKVEQPAPVESPDDWVILDPVVYAEHELRKDIDWIFVADWQPVNGYAGCTIDEFIRSPQNKVRCRRKDLPPVPPKTRTVVLKEWICWDVAHPDIITLEWCSTDPSEDSGSFVEYDNAQATGETRTVEIPVT